MLSTAVKPPLQTSKLLLLLCRSPQCTRTVQVELSQLHNHKRMQLPLHISIHCKISSIYSQVVLASCATTVVAIARATIIMTITVASAN